VKAAIFDFDGVIADSEPLHFRALRDALRTEGVEITEQEYYTSYLAYDDRGALRLALEQHGVAASRERLETLAVRKVECFAEVLRDIVFFPGVPELVRALAGRVPVGIASGARRPEIEAILEAGGLRDAFSAIVGVEDVSRTKPDPEPYLTAMSRLAARAPGLRPAECVVFEDSIPGILAGKAAGMTVVAVTNSYPADKLGVADRVVADFAGRNGEALLSLFAS
jgi:beta-phosphoglucomutase-like phosphatase (HAD superfamily)